MKDLLNTTCQNCKRGTFIERCFFDDIDGWVTCNICGVSTSRWPIIRERSKKMRQGILNKTKVYLIGAMQYADGSAWRNDMTLFLNEMGVVTFDPYKKPFIDSPDESPDVHMELSAMMEAGDFESVERHMKKVRAFDLSMVDRSDFIIAYINPTVPTFGTMEELVVAVRMKRPVFVMIEGGKTKIPYWLLGMLPHKYFYESFDEVKDMLSKIDNGEKELDSDRWRLFKPELR